MEIREQLQRNLSGVRQRIEAAAMRSGRAPDAATLVAVTKYAKLEWVQELISLGQRDLGEARPQQLSERAELLGTSDFQLNWHLIGHLQRNKIRRVVEQGVLIHSVDSWKLLEAIERIAAESHRRPSVLLEINLTQEESKDGFSEQDLRDGWTQINNFRNVEVIGLMTMARATDDPEDTRPTFTALRQMRDELRESSPFRLPELSMGMTGDFEVAIEEGATMVRVGSALFEGLE